MKFSKSFDEIMDNCEKSFAARETRMQSKDKNSWPGNREYIGTVLTGKGEYKLYLPTYEDLSDYKVTQKDVENPNAFSAYTAAISAGITLDEFKNLSYPDASAILILVAEAMQKLKPYIHENKIAAEE